jgi:serine protease Do
MEDFSSLNGTSSPGRSLSRQRVWISSLLVLAILIGIGIGLSLSGDTWAGQENHVITVGHSTNPPTPAVSAALALSAAFAEAARAVEPAVVHIETASPPERKSDNPLDFFRNPHRSRRGAGSGVLVDREGYILTNHHVVDEASTIRVKLRDGRVFTPDVIGKDEIADLAVLKIKGSTPFPYAVFGDSDKSRVGDWVLAIGSPFGLEQTVTAGIISAIDRDTAGAYRNFQRFIQTDAAINPGNSGGPLVNLRGEVVGINTQISTETGFYNGVGFAIPTSVIAGIYKQLASRGTVERGWLGITLDEVKPEVARVYGLSDAYGALVLDVASEDSPAARAGLRTADIIVEYEGNRVENHRHLTRMVADTEVGKAIRLKFIRDGREMATSVKIGSRNTGLASRLPGLRNFLEKAPSQPQRQDEPVEFGAKLSSVSPDVAKKLNLGSTKGALVTEIEDGSLASDLSLEAGDVIVKLNRQEISGPDHLQALFSQLRSGDDLVLEVAGPSRRLRSAGRSIVSTVIP